MATLPIGVVGVAPDVARAIAIEIHRQTTIAVGHELRHAHRAGVGAGQAQRVEMIFTRHQQKLFKLGAKEGCACGVVAGVMKGEGRKRIDDAITAGIRTIGSLDADDGDDDLGRDAIGFRGAQHRRFVGTPERRAIANALVGDEQRAGVRTRV